MPKRILYKGEQVIAIRENQLSDLRFQIEGYQSYILQSDSNARIYKRRIDSLRVSFADLNEIITNQDEMIENKNIEIKNLKDISRNKNKMWMRRFIYGSGGGIALGLVAGILIAK